MNNCSYVHYMDNTFTCQHRFQKNAARPAARIVPRRMSSNTNLAAAHANASLAGLNSLRGGQRPAAAAHFAPLAKYRLAVDRLAGKTAPPHFAQKFLSIP